MQKGIFKTSKRNVIKLSQTSNYVFRSSNFVLRSLAFYLPIAIYHTQRNTIFKGKSVVFRNWWNSAVLRIRSHKTEILNIRRKNSSKHVSPEANMCLRDIGLLRTRANSPFCLHVPTHLLSRKHWIE